MFIKNPIVLHTNGRGLAARSQKGTTLIVALVLILLATLLSLFALNVGLFGQRSSANDVRARLVQQTAESGIAQGIEYFRANFSTALDPTDSGQWTLCTATDTTFPCGAVPVCANGATSGTGCTSTGLARRGNMYKYTKGAGYDVNGNGSSSDNIDKNSLPLDRRIGSVGNGFNVDYGVGALLCVVKQPTAAGQATECTTSMDKASNVKLLTLVSVARIPGESANTTLTQTTGLYGKLSSVTNAPPLVASGAIDLTGGLQMVTSPNAAGTGVPVSVWTRLSVDKTGTPNTCYLNDFIHDPKQTPSYLGTDPQIVVCDDCDCQTSLSYANSGNSQEEGIDILNIEHNPPNVYANDSSATPVVGTSACTDSTQATCRANFDIKPTEFPCDLFEYIFGTKAWDDDIAVSGAAYTGCGDNGNSGDCFCETSETMVDYGWTDSGGVPHTTKMRVDDKWLFDNANYVIPRTGQSTDPTVYNTDAKIISCSDLNSSSSGLIWDQTGNCIPTSGDIGSPDNPVVLVEDEAGSTTIGVHITSKPRIFGLLFVRVPLGTPITKTGQSMDPSTGGYTGGPAYAFQMEGGTVYGAVVVQGAVKKGNGGGTIVSEPLILAKLAKELPLSKFANVPGSWSDRYSY